MRRLNRFMLPSDARGSYNPLYRLYETVPVRRVAWSVCVNLAARVIPHMGFKNWVYRRLLRMRIGRGTAIALYAMMDTIHPEWITIGDNCIVGYHTTILTHEYLIDEYRFGPVVIEDEVMIGANVTILAGVTIGRRAVIGAGSVVTRDIPAGAFAAGSPARVIRSGQEDCSRQP